MKVEKYTAAPHRAAGLTAGLLLCVFFLLAVGGRAAARGAIAAGTPAPVQKNVLVLLPYEINLPTSQMAVQEYQEKFGKNSDMEIGLYFEFVDINRFADPDFQRHFFDWLASKYQEKNIDLVIVQGETVLNLWLEERQEFLSAAPVVFYDINSTRIRELTLAAGVSGVGGAVNHEKTLLWYLQAHPQVNEVVLLHGIGAADQPYIRHLEYLPEKAGRPVQVNDLSNLPLAEIKQRVAALPDSAVVLYELMFEDTAGIKYRPIDALREVAAVSSVPVLSSYEQFIGTGSIGGYMYSVSRQAQFAAQLSLRILRGETQGEIISADDASSRYIFDHLALQRYGIALSALPQDSEIRNRQYSAWELYQREIIAAAAIFCAVLLLVVYLIVVLRRLHAASQLLTGLNESLEQQVLERTETLNQTNQQLAEEISERKLALEALRESELRFRTIIEKAPVAVSIGRDGRLLYANPRYVSMHGFESADELIGTPTINRIPERFRENALDRSQRRKLGLPVDEQYEMISVRKDGSEFPMISSVSRINLADGPANIGFFQDITALKRSEEALRASEEQYRNLLNILPVGVVVHRGGIILLANYASAEYFGAPSPAALIGSALMERVHPDYREEVKNRVQRLSVENNSVPLIEEKLLRLDGSAFDAEVAALTVKYENEPATLAMFNDITQRKLAEDSLLEAHNLLEQRVQERTAALQAANQDLEKAARMKNDFLASMSHELRTPLSGILGLAEVMQLPTYAPLTEKQKTAVMHIQNSGRHLLELINEILDLAKVEAGKMELHRTRFGLEHICQESLRMVSTQAETKHLQTSLSLPAQPVLLDADEIRLRQVLINLLSNAIKFTPDGGSVGIEASLQPELRRVRICVWDTGIGIRSEDLPKLFQSFVQLDARLSRQYSGTGLGLALVKQLVELHGGSVEVQSEPEKGSRFSVLLPYDE